MPDATMLTGPVRRLSLTICALVALVLAPAGAQAFETRVLTMTHDGLERRAILDVQPEARNAPVLIALHGGLAGPRTVRRRARVSLAREGWAVLWPYAIDDWNDGRTDWLGEPHDDADDIGFLRRLIGALADQGVVDPERVFVAGPSIGGIMALRLMCDAPDLVAGVAVAIAAFAEDYECRTGPARPVLFIHGTADRLVPPDGGRIGGWSPLVAERGDVMPVDQTLEILAERNGCNGFDSRGLEDRVPEDGSTVTLRTYRSCDAPLLHFVVEGGGHTWPGARASGLGTRIVGSTNQDFSATEAVERFFRQLAAE
ncbi:MAG: PHB depolymerase family esterase [Pseudomonadota bacterium]